MFVKFHEYLSTFSSVYIAVISLFTILCLGFIDFSIGPEISFSVFYIFPILVATWYARRSIGIAASFISAIVWFIADASGDSQYSHDLVPVWNSGVRLCFFLIFRVLNNIGV